jgi:hypothetical protein
LESKAIRSPSGDQAGSRSSNNVFSVNLVTFIPSAFAV